MSAAPSSAAAAPTAVRVLDAAEALFAERGFRGTSLSEVADRVGIRAPSLFNHFASKRALYEAVLSRLLDPFFGLLEALAAEADTPARARAAVERLLAHHLAQPRLACLLQQAALAGGEELDLLVERWYQPFFARLPQLLPASLPAAASGDPRALVMAFNSLILGYLTLAPLHARLLGLDPLGDEAAARYRELLVRLAEGA